MSRSRKYTHGKAKVVFTAFACCRSEKKDKRLWNRLARRISRKMLNSDTEALLPLIRELTNVYDGGKDGKQMVWPSSKHYKDVLREK
jgi:hypothetical protein